MDGGHQAFFDAKTLLEQDVNKRGQTIGGTTGVGDDIVACGVVLVVVHAHDDGDVLRLGGGGDDDLLRARQQVAMAGVSRDFNLLACARILLLELRFAREEPGGFDHEFNAERLPRQISGRPGADDAHFPAVDDQDVVIGFLELPAFGLGLGFGFGEGFGGSARVDGALETALGGIVLEKVGEVVGRHDVPDGDDVKFLSEKTLLGDGAEDKAADAAKPVDGDFNWHVRAFVWNVEQKSGRAS